MKELASVEETKPHLASGAVAWLKSDPSLIDHGAIADMNVIMQVVEAVRSLRSEAGIPRPHRVKAVFQGDQGILDLLKSMEEAISQPYFMGLEEVSYRLSGPKPDGTLAAITPKATVFVYHEVKIDRPRLEKKVLELNAQRQKIEERLSNPGYLDKAPRDKIEKDRTDLVEIESVLGKIRNELA